MLEDIIFKLVPGLQESEPVFLIVCVFLEFKQVELTPTLSITSTACLPPAVHMYG